VKTSTEAWCIEMVTITILILQRAYLNKRDLLASPRAHIVGR
jgi:hypothetical protein